MIATSNPYVQPFASNPFNTNPFGRQQTAPQPAPQEQPREMSLPRIVNYLAK